MLLISSLVMFHWFFQHGVCLFKSGPLAQYDFFWSVWLRHHTLEIAHRNVTCSQSDLYIDHWSEKHDTEGNLIKQFEGQVKMVNVPEQKYLGYILPEDGSNMKNILPKQKRSFGIIKDIQYLVRGLGKYTFEGGLIYLNSLL